MSSVERAHKHLQHAILFLLDQLVLEILSHVGVNISRLHTQEIDWGAQFGPLWFWATEVRGQTQSKHPVEGFSGRVNSHVWHWHY